MSFYQTSNLSDCLRFGDIVTGLFSSEFNLPHPILNELPDEYLLKLDIKKIKDEAEDVLRVVGADGDKEEASEEAVQDDSKDAEPEAESATEASQESEETQSMPAAKKYDDDDDEAHLLDEESADPEIQLDLARAYISMGDKEAARIILEEVIANGSEQQQAEAKKMKELF